MAVREKVRRAISRMARRLMELPSGLSAPPPCEHDRLQYALKDNGRWYGWCRPCGVWTYGPESEHHESLL